MRTYPSKKLFTVDEYYRMAEAGILKPNDRVELIRGEVIEMSPNGRKHAACVDRAAELFFVSMRGRAIVRVQGPDRLDQYNEPQPDISILKPKADYYRSGHPGPDDIYLVIEVSDTTLEYDREVKLAMYAISGIREFWMEDLQGDVLLVHRDASDDHYKTCLVFKRGESVSPLAFPDVALRVDDLLG
jgi:Uma2 family endonuclease